MCECLEYEDGEMHLCVVCADMWRAWEAAGFPGIENGFAAVKEPAPEPVSDPFTLPAVKATSAPACTSATIEGEPGHESCSVCGHPFPPDSSHALRRCGVRNAR